MNRIHQKMSLEQKIKTLKEDFPDRARLIKVVDTPFKVRMRISPDGSWTDDKTVWVATEVFDDIDPPICNRIDTFLGTT